MGMSYVTSCKECAHRFKVRVGGGFNFHLLHCTRCGRDRSIDFDELGEVHLQYLKGLEGPCSIATADRDEMIRDTYTGPAISQATYQRKVQKFAGLCQCGGRFTFRAKPRCPKCHSARLLNHRGNYVLHD